MQAECHRAWADSGENDKACGLDRAYPNCACEVHSLREQGGGGVADNEVLARVFTDPASYNLSTSAMVTAKITSVHGAGLSTIRQGASDREISDTINALLNGAQEAQTLVGAAVFETSIVREIGGPERWFGAYATDDYNKEHHVDILGTCPKISTNQANKMKSARRSELRKVLERGLIRKSDPVELIAELRNRGI
jgi:hypothetical protein